MQISARVMVVVGLLLSMTGFAVGSLSAAPTPQSSAGCGREGDLDFICGVDRPEDLAHIPGSPWIIASGFSAGAGLKIIDARRRSMRFWFSATPDQVRPDPVHFPDCASPPAPGKFNARGLSLRMTSRHGGRLHVVNHGGRESVEVFDVRLTSREAEPKLTWKGCLLLPSAHVANAVGTFRDGTVLVTVLTRPGTTITDFERGMNTGAVFQRSPGAASFQMIPGTELPGNNGLQISKDDREFYVVAFGLRAVAIFRRGDAHGPVARVKAPGFMPDNIHYSSGRLLAAGMVSDEPACGGVRQIINGVADTMQCHRGYRVAELRPRSRSFRTVAEGPRSAAFNGVSSALIIGRDLWLGSYQADRLAVRLLRSSK